MKYLDSWHILKVDPTGFSDSPEVGRESKKGLQTDFSPEQVEGCRCPHWDTESWEWSSFGGRGTKIQFQKCGVSDAVPEMKPVAGQEGLGFWRQVWAGSISTEVVFRTLGLRVA